MTICEHIKDNGDTCGSPALTGYSFCYFHQRLRHPRHRPGDFEYKLPILDTPESILMAIQHITQAALDGVLEDKRARLVLSALRLAQSTLKQMKKDEKTRDEKTNVGVNPTADSASSTLAPVLSSRGPLLAEGSASAPVTTAIGAAEAAPSVHQPASDLDHAAAAAPEGSPRREPWVSVTSTTKAPAGATDIPPKQPPLSAHQAKLLKKILRRGPKHPQFHLAARLLDHHIADAS